MDQRRRLVCPCSPKIVAGCASKGLSYMERDWHLVAYDIRDGKRLRKVAKILEGFGFRTQYSIFRCRLSPRMRAELVWKLDKILLKEDALLVLPMCDRCTDKVVERGALTDWTALPAPFVII